MSASTLALWAVGVFAYIVLACALSVWIGRALHIDDEAEGGEQHEE